MHLLKQRAKQRAFIWTEYRQWRPIIMRLLADELDRNVLLELKASPPEYFVADNLSWLDEIIFRIKPFDNVDIVACLIERLPSVFGFVRAYHGCRTVSVDSYREKGLLLGNPETLKATARSIFTDKARVEEAIQELALSYEEQNRGIAYFCLTMDELKELYGHYLLYGSEYLLCIANRVFEPHILKSRGKATVVECNVPISDLPKASLRLLAGQILREICERYCDRKYQPGGIHFGFRIFRPLAPENIVGFQYPTGIPNPHNSRIRED